MCVGSKPSILPTLRHDVGHRDNPKGHYLPAYAVGPRPACKRNDEKKHVKREMHKVRGHGFPPWCPARQRRHPVSEAPQQAKLSLIHISEPTRQAEISYAV